MKFLVTSLSLVILTLGSAVNADGGLAGQSADAEKAATSQDKGKMMAMMDHASPMPGLMRVFKKHADELSLNKEQSDSLSQVKADFEGKAHGLVNNIIADEKAISQAAMDNKPREEIMKIGEELMKKRLDLIDTKAACRDNMRKVVSDDQWVKLLAVYEANYL